MSKRGGNHYEKNSIASNDIRRNISPVENSMINSVVLCCSKNHTSGEREMEGRE